MSEVELRPYRPGDEVVINRGFNEVFGLSRPLAEWGWKFPLEPGGRTIMLAWRGEELLVHYAGMPKRIAVDGREWSAATIVDVFTTPAARKLFARRGLLGQTVDEFIRVFGVTGQASVCFGFPGRRALRLGVHQHLYDVVQPQPITYLRRERAPQRSRLSRLFYRAELARDWEPRLDDLWQRVRPSYPVAVVRDAERCLRRLAGHPSVRYHRFLVCPRFSDQPVAFAAFRTDQNRCRWVDLLWDHDHPGALELLSRLGASLARQVGAGEEELWLNQDPAGAQLLETHGFQLLPEPNGLMLVTRSFAPELDEKVLEGRVYLTMADADLV